MNGVGALPGKCRYCFKEITRKDNLRRHETQTCEKVRISCKCGMKIRKSSLSRHLQKCDWYCKTNEIPPETEIDKSGQQQAQLNEMQKDF